MAFAKPVLVIVGRPNVGKSTLFNRITGSRDALVHDLPGVTRDRLYGEGRRGGRAFWVVDTGGLEGDEDALSEPLTRQTLLAIDEADVVLLLVDCRAGLTPADRMIAERLRRSGQALVVAANKAEGREPSAVTAEFHELGLGAPIAVSAEHGDGIGRLMDTLLQAAPPPPCAAELTDEDDEDRTPQVALVGRPNVGKSTLSNALVGAERVVVSDIPGTTRDTVRIPLERDGVRVDLLDTAGVRRRSRLDRGLEQLSVIRTLRTLEVADVVLLVIDARAGISDQDAHLAGLVRRHGRSAVLVVNKWDGLDGRERGRIRLDLDRTLGFLGNVERLYVSALHGGGLGTILPAIERAHASAVHAFGTGELNRMLADALAAHSPPTVGGRRIRIKYAHQGGRNPPIIVLHGNQLDHLPEAYRRYLVNYFTRAGQLVGVPVRLVLHEGRNPYAGRPRSAAAKGGDRGGKRRGGGGNRTRR